MDKDIHSPSWALELGTYVSSGGKEHMFSSEGGATRSTAPALSPAALSLSEPGFPGLEVSDAGSRKWRQACWNEWSVQPNPWSALSAGLLGKHAGAPRLQPQVVRHKCQTSLASLNNHCDSPTPEIIKTLLEPILVCLPTISRVD